MSKRGLLRHPFLRLLMPLMVGIGCGDFNPHSPPLWSCSVAALILLATLLIGKHYSLRWLYGPAVHLFLCGVGYQLASRQMMQTDYAFSDQPAVYKVRIQEAPQPKARSILCTSALTDVDTLNTLQPTAQGNLFLLYFAKDSLAATLKRGDELLIHARLSAPVNHGNPDGFDYVRHLKHKGVTGTAYVAAGRWKVVGHDSLRTLRQMALDCREEVVALYRRLGFGKDELAVLSALTVGDKEELSDEIVETYSVTGASHVLALSGLHIGFIYGLFWFILSPLWKRWRSLKPLLLLFIIAFLWGFAFLTGLSSSVVRSVIMFSLLALASLQPEKPFTLNTLAATAFVMLLCHPAWLFDVGFQLSFSAVAAIVLLQPRFYALWRVENRFLRSVWGLVTVSVAAQLGTAPLVMLYFSRFSTHFLLTNLWVIPLVSLIMYSAVLLLMLSPFLFLQQTFASAVDALVRIQNEVLHWIEHLPYASVDAIWLDAWQVLLFYLLIVLAYRSWTRCTARRLCLLLVSLLLIVSYRAVSTLLYSPQRSIVFYNIRGCPAVHCLEGTGQSWLACADSVPDVSRLHHTLSSYWSRLNLHNPQVIAQTYASPFLTLDRQILCYGHKRICLLNNDYWRHKTADAPLALDYLYLCNGYKGSLKELTSLFSIQTVVLDASLSAYKQERFIQECLELGISYLSVSAKGTVCILL